MLVEGNAKCWLSSVNRNPQQERSEMRTAVSEVICAVRELSSSQPVDLGGRDAGKHE